MGSVDDDPDAAPEMVLPLVVRLERAEPPQRTDALEAAARAVLALLADARTTGGEWSLAVRQWEAGRIRKVVRRARGAGWSRAVALPGLTATVRSAEVRVFPPVPLDGWPPDLARLQVGGTELEDATPPPPSDPAHPRLWVNPGLTMTAGKAMAQVGHGAQLLWWASDEPTRDRWVADGLPVAVRTASAPQWARLVGSGLPTVRDGGLTELEPGSLTVVGEVPAIRHT
jgi:peptidyl-tRNA hydrolase